MGLVDCNFSWHSLAAVKGRALWSASLAKLKRINQTPVERSLSDEFKAELTDLIESYVLKGLGANVIGDVLENMSAQIATAVALAYVNMAIKCFVVITCTATPIWMLINDKHDPFLYGTMLLSYLSVVLQFFDVNGAVELARKLKRSKLI